MVAHGAGTLGCDLSLSECVNVGQVILVTTPQAVTIADQADMPEVNDSAAMAWVMNAPTCIAVPVRIVAETNDIGTQPLTFGIPLPKGGLRWPVRAECDGLPFVTHGAQLTSLATWSDGSLKWVLFEGLASQVTKGHRAGTIRLLAADSDSPSPTWSHHSPNGKPFTIKTAVGEFVVSDSSADPLIRFRRAFGGDLGCWSGRIRFRDRKGIDRAAFIDAVIVESVRPLKTTIRLDGRFRRGYGLRLRVRLSCFSNTGLVRIDLCVHNPHRARHRGGLWDLGDPGSRYFKELAIEFRRSRPVADGSIGWQVEPNGDIHRGGDGDLEIYQDSSGGENWQSSNHANRNHRVPCRFPGYRERTPSAERFGSRANPIVAVDDGATCVTGAIPEFWQQFPKSIEASKDVIRFGLFPRQWDDLFEIQGGERKSHTVWMQFEPSESATGLDGMQWVHSPIRVCSTLEWVAGSGAIPELGVAGIATSDRFDDCVTRAIDGPMSFFSGRESIDEYGWRNYGDVWADHEGAYYAGKAPVISHYNNQFDVVYGAILQWLRTSDRRWWDVAGPLARHVMDIDIYHTTRDRAAYNGGLFWFTDHYLDAATSSHRTYSRSNKPAAGQPYGGGPGSEHNFATGLLHYHYLTGDLDARDAVIGLADWVIRMDDGRLSALRFVDGGPTGLASAHWGSSQNAPGRGGANSIQVLLDAWSLCGAERYLLKVEELIRRCIHPADDVASLDLLDAEKNWSYTMFLAALDRYLSVKAEADQLDDMYAYAQQSLLHYARWMLVHERPYLDARERLEYPTETWAAQDLRKANVLRQAARHADPGLASALALRGDQLAESAWRQFLSFEAPWTARAMALVMVDGTRDARSDWRSDRAPPPRKYNADFGMPQSFVSQKQRIRRELHSVPGIGRLAMRALGLRTRSMFPRKTPS